MTPCPKPKTYRSKAKLKFIRSKPCEVCGTIIGVQAHHESVVSNSNGMGMKTSDEHTLPLCYRCHQLRHQLGAKTFWGDRLKGLYKVAKKYHKEFLSLRKVLNVEP